MKPTEEQLKDPKWWDENAPDIWATDYDADDHYFFCPKGHWASITRNWQSFHNPQTYYQIKKTGRTFSRPTTPPAPEWDGKSAPAPGELAQSSGGKCSVIGYDSQRKNVAVQWYDGELGVIPVGALKPLRTKEQRDVDQLAEFINAQRFVRGGFSAKPDVVAREILAWLKERNQ